MKSRKRPNYTRLNARLDQECVRLLKAVSREHGVSLAESVRLVLRNASAARRRRAQFGAAPNALSPGGLASHANLGQGAEGPRRMDVEPFGEFWGGRE
jgi:hypothetical protein